MIVNNNDYQNSTVTFSSGSDAGFTRVITASSTTSGFTVGQALPAAPTVGSSFTINAAELAGTGASTFVTDSGPSVNTLNHFTTVVTDFSNEAGFIAPNQTPGRGPIPDSVGGPCRWEASDRPSHDRLVSKCAGFNEAEEECNCHPPQPQSIGRLATYEQCATAVAHDLCFNWIGAACPFRLREYLNAQCDL